MPRFPFRFPQAVLAGFALTAGPAAAQIPAPGVMPPPAPVVHAPVPAAPPAALTSAVDPQVTALFAQTVAAHQALSALSATITLSAAGAGAGAGTGQTIMLAYQKPHQAKIAVAAGGGPVVQIFCNGETLTIYAVAEKKYRVQPVPTGTDPIPLVLDQGHALLPRLLGHPEALKELLAQPGVTARVVSASDSAQPVPVSGAAVDTVTATLPAPSGGEASFTFDIGRTDHLLRRVTENVSAVNQGKTQQFALTETVTALAATPNLTAADFVFTPPPGVTKDTAKAAAVPAQPPMHDPRLAPGAKPFMLAAKDLSGKPLSLAQYKGRVVLMDFWATWCGPCIGEMPNVIAAYKKYHAQGFDVVGISLDESRPALTTFLAENKMPWRQVFDGKGWNSAVPRRYGVMAIPFGLLIGRDGKIAAVDVRGPALTSAIKAALEK